MRANRRMQGEIFRIILLSRAFSFSGLSCSSQSRCSAPSAIWPIGQPSMGADRRRVGSRRSPKSLVFWHRCADHRALWGRRAWGIWGHGTRAGPPRWCCGSSMSAICFCGRFAAGPQVQTLAAVLGILARFDVPIVYSRTAGGAPSIPHPSLVARRARA